MLLEINPDVRDGMTDPCLFRKAELDGAFRFIGGGREYPFVWPKSNDESFDDLLVDVVKPDAAFDDGRRLTLRPPTRLTPRRSRQRRVSTRRQP